MIYRRLLGILIGLKLSLAPLANTDEKSSHFALLSPEESLTQLQKEKDLPYFLSPEKSECNSEDLIKAKLLEDLHRGDIPNDYPWFLLMGLYPQAKDHLLSLLDSAQRQAKRLHYQYTTDAQDTVVRSDEEKTKAQKNTTSSSLVEDSRANELNKYPPLETQEDIEKILRSRLRDRIVGASSSYAYHELDALIKNIPRFEQRLQLIREFYLQRSPELQNTPLQFRELQALVRKLEESETGNTKEFKAKLTEAEKRFQPNSTETGLTDEDIKKMKAEVRALEASLQSLKADFEKAPDLRERERLSYQIKYLTELQQRYTFEMKEIINKAGSFYRQHRRTFLPRVYAIIPKYSDDYLREIASRSETQKLQFLKELVVGQSSLHKAVVVPPQLSLLSDFLGQEMKREIHDIVGSSGKKEVNLSNWLAPVRQAIINLDEATLTYTSKEYTKERLHKAYRTQQQILDLIARGLKPGSLELMQALKYEENKDVWKESLKHSPQLLESFLRSDLGRTVAFSGIGIIAEVGRRIYDEKSLKEFLKESCGLEPLAVEKISPAIYFSNIYKGLPFTISPSKYCSEIVVDVSHTLKIFQKEIQNSQKLTGGACALVNMQTKRWEKTYLRDVISLTPPSENSSSLCVGVKLFANKEEVGEFISHKNKPYLKLPACEDHIGILLPIEWFEERWIINPEKIECFTEKNKSRHKKAALEFRHSYCHTLREHFKKMPSPGFGQQSHPRLTIEAFYRGALKALEKINNPYASGALTKILRYPMAIRSGLVAYRERGCLEESDGKQKIRETSTKSGLSQ
jgi:hypothetical protein